ncbi:epithelial sodium channel subunit beta-like isoform X2 [Convolutriloba macropyga]
MVLTDADRDNEVKWQEYFLFNSGMAATLQSLVKFCQWKGQDCLDLGSWKQVWTLNVLCWEFTPHERRVQIPDDKLTMIFDLETEEGIPFLHIAGGLALQVFLYDPTRTILSTWDKSYSFNVAPGYSYRASLSLEEFHDDSGRSDCIQEGAKGILKYHDDGYTHMTCVSECFADKELETCGCNSVGVYFMPKNITVPCDGVTMVMCPFHQANAMESCMQACRPQCSFNKYHATNTMTKFPSINAAKSLKKITKLSNRVPSNGTISEYHCDMRQNYAELQVSIGSFLVRRTRIMPKYNFAKATSAMGGLFGLLLGGSMLSVYEIFELLLQLFCRFVKNILNKIGNKVGKKVQSDDDIPCID